MHQHSTFKQGVGLLDSILQRRRPRSMRLVRHIWQGRPEADKVQPVLALKQGKPIQSKKQQRGPRNLG